MITLKLTSFDKLGMFDKFVFKHDFDWKEINYIEVMFKNGDFSYIGTGILYSDSRKNTKNKIPACKGHTYEFAQVYQLVCK